ncbi:hypothetical protein GCU67_09240 [Modestobacter muralis]|uniref:Secreted protein n=1 Tax=Modestobacter muralis TaxID=1608614 RepID=A0A6P0ETT1_9ACTN|nr:hypothetical protein [Modestobacter muralis]NEK94355.1 hypothetical protein [Modestobacter muralis]NEN51243.1 hypothetical protein [Modestobacter muralis]
MSRLRSRALLVAVSVATVLGFDATAAQAGFTARAALPVTAGTVTVAPPSGLSTAGTRCTTTSYGWYSTRTMHATVSWQASPTRGVSGYQLTAVLANGTVHPIGTVPASTTTVSQSEDAALAEGARVRLTTLTSYGWTSTTVLTGALTC